MKWEITEVGVGHEDDRRVLRDWFSDAVFGEPLRRVTLFKGKAGKAIGNHYHEKQTEIYFVLEGNGQMTLYNLDTGEKELINVRPYTKIVIPCRVAHTLHFDTDIILEIASTKQFDPKDADMVPYKIL